MDPRSVEDKPDGISPTLSRPKLRREHLGATLAQDDPSSNSDANRLAEAKRGFVLLPKRWVVERSFGWLARFRRLSRDFERMPQVLAGLHFVVFVMLMLMLMLPKIAMLWVSSPFQMVSWLDFMPSDVRHDNM